MTKRQAERISGKRYEKTGKEWVAYDGDVEIARVKYQSDSIAIRILAEKVFKHNAVVVWERQGGRCAFCGKFKPLQRDHRRARSSREGRDDRSENIQWLCLECHEDKTLGRTGSH